MRQLGRQRNVTEDANVSSPHTSRSTARRFACAAVACAGLLGASVTPALALEANIAVKPARVTPELAVCPGQSFSQPFAALNDFSYYTLVEGSEFNGPEEGWALSGGAQIVPATRPDGSSGQVLDLPSGAEAVSPPVCVTLLYTRARIWAETIQGGGAVAVSVSYAGTDSEQAPRGVGRLQGQLGSWALSRRFSVPAADRRQDRRNTSGSLPSHGRRRRERLPPLRSLRRPAHELRGTSLRGDEIRR